MGLAYCPFKLQMHSTKTCEIMIIPADFYKGYMKIKIMDLTVQDIRFPLRADDSLLNKESQKYSAAYVTLYTNYPALKGYGLIITADQSSAVCVAAIKMMRYTIINKELTQLTEHIGDIWHQIITDPDLHALVSDKNIIHLATAAIMNAVWDLWARRERKPLWRLIVNMSPEELIRCLHFNDLTDTITAAEALEILRNNAPTKAQRIAHLLQNGYPAYRAVTGQPSHGSAGKHVNNRVMFKELLQTDAVDFSYADSCRAGGVNEMLILLLMAAKFNVPMSPRTSGMGLDEYSQHLAMVDYIYISGLLENRMLEYADHLHEHFTAPATIQNGHYQVPLASGYSIEIKESSLIQYNYPHGRAWGIQ